MPDNQIDLKFRLYRDLLLQSEKINLRINDFLDIALTELRHGRLPQEILDLYCTRILGLVDPRRKKEVLNHLRALLQRLIVLRNVLEEVAATERKSAIGTIKHFLERVKEKDLDPTLKESYRFYSLGITINEADLKKGSPYAFRMVQRLVEALKTERLDDIQPCLLQLKHTPLTSEKDEAELLLLYLESVFYEATIRLQQSSLNEFSNAISLSIYSEKDNLEFLSRSLKTKIVDIYMREIEKLKTYCTFPPIIEKLNLIILRLKGVLDRSLHDRYMSPEELLEELKELSLAIKREYEGVYANKIDKLVTAVQLYGFHFASIQTGSQSADLAYAVDHILKFLSKNSLLPSRISPHAASYLELSPVEQMVVLEQLLTQNPLNLINYHSKFDEKTSLILRHILTLQHIQHANGKDSIKSWILTGIDGPQHVLEALLLIAWCGVKDELHIQLVPHFDSLESISAALNIMRNLYDHYLYESYLNSQQYEQRILIDCAELSMQCGEWCALWKIFKAKEELVELSKSRGINLVFIDGDNWLAARLEHAFYSAVGDTIFQTSHLQHIPKERLLHGNSTPEAAFSNMEQLFTAGLEHHLFPNPLNQLSVEDTMMLDQIAHDSFQAYINLDLKDAEVAKFYGVGSALKQLIERGNEREMITLYEKSLLFRVMVENCKKHLAHSLVPFLTYKKSDPKWEKIVKEYELTRKLLNKLGEPILPEGHLPIMIALYLF